MGMLLSGEFIFAYLYLLRFPDDSAVKRICLKCRGCRFDPWVGKSPKGGNGNPLQYSCLGNPMDRGALWATVHGVAKESDTT